MHEIGHSGLVHWDDTGGWDGEGGGRGIQHGGHMYTQGISTDLCQCMMKATTIL